MITGFFNEHGEYERVFGKKPRVQSYTPSTVFDEKVDRKTKTMCPHCATKNFVKKTKWDSVCKHCGYEN